MQLTIASYRIKVEEPLPEKVDNCRCVQNNARVPAPFNSKPLNPSDGSKVCCRRAQETHFARLSAAMTLCIPIKFHLHLHNSKHP